MTIAAQLPAIIQGGMGIGVSNWRLAQAVSKLGGLGVVSGTAIDTVLVRRLQLGDEGGHMRRALAQFPLQETAARIVSTYFVPGGLGPQAPFKLAPLPSSHMSAHRLELIVVANFVEVFLAKEGHLGPVGINYLEKIQLPTLASLYGALLANVDVVLMGAGIPTAIPGILDALVRGEGVEMKLHVEGGPQAEPVKLVFSALDVFGTDPLLTLERTLAPKRPLFLPIISSHVLAKTLLKKSSGRVDGFVVETHVAGGHNAPPRKSRADHDPNQPWGALDEPDLEIMAGLGVPFWLAGSQNSKEDLAQARALGAHGIQVGTAFAYCDESGITTEEKRRTIARSKSSLRVVTDFEASPTGYPFKLVLDDTKPHELMALRDRSRLCDLGFLRQSFIDAHGRLDYRCPGEPHATYLKKGGTQDATKNKICLCNGLLATVGLGQRRAEGDELPIFTSGVDLKSILRFVPPGAHSYGAKDVFAALTA